MQNDFAVTDTKTHHLGELINKTHAWAVARNLIDGSSPKDQYCKLMEEAGELASSICKGRDPKDDIGDMLVVLIVIAGQYNTTLEECLALAYDEIKDRKGVMIDGIFVKE